MVYTTELASPACAASSAARPPPARRSASSSARAPRGSSTSRSARDGVDLALAHPVHRAASLFCVVGWFLRRGIAETRRGHEGRGRRVRRSSRRSLADWRPMRADVRHRRDDERRVLPDVHVRRRARTHGPEATPFLLANTLSLVVVLFSKVLGGWLSDRVGRRRLMIVLTVVMMVVVYPALRADAVRHAVAVHDRPDSCSAVPLGMALGLQGAMVVELFPLRTRVTSMSFAYSITLALAGGTAPLVSTWLIDALRPQPRARVLHHAARAPRPRADVAHARNQRALALGLALEIRTG